ncbi:glycoside hydrolase family 17 protein [Lentiprolixibacter aurantiacus]|uniref:Endo-1,3-beta-glucanase btgC n=1 Tax=Lentiprolixibacter aurantiacus TaxID=2993939 RepID=A0AAE3ML80_9FLAO|nr:glycosyl hydrolase family 17 protein [Lentiprolixibacter aurantiacus]MCX2719825.1 glycosyl hydrolase family 17 protein [Lentiprolixibacter aurantiacus]
MSYIRKEKRLALAALDYAGMSKKDLQKLAREILEEGMHGLCFSPYEEGQKPGDQISEEQIRRRMEIIAPYTDWIRSFSCTEGNEEIPRIAREFGIKSMAGAWLGDDPEINANEIKNLIEITNQGYVDIAAVGNEVMLRGDLNEDQLLDFIQQVKDGINVDVPVAYVDAYYEFAERPRIADACDVILANCYPFWEGCDMDYSLLYIKDMYQRALRAGNGKKVIISETGWPSQGTSLEGAYPSYENYLKYFMNMMKWAQEDDIEIFYFSSFDESWKVGAEGDVGAYWGLWDKDEQLKF